MSFTLREVLEGHPLAVQHPVCPTGKASFTTKAEARAALRTINRTERTPMRPFRCSYCALWHVGHRRGAVL